MRLEHLFTFGARVAVRKLPYRELIGGLQYLATAMRPDIAHSVSALAQFNNSDTEQHWGAAKLRYLMETQTRGLKFSENQSPVDFIDADWGGCITDRRSYTGYTFTLSGTSISWKFQKRRTVALLTTEAEYMALAEALKECLPQKFLERTSVIRATRYSTLY